MSVQATKTVLLGDVATIRRGASPRPIDNPKWFTSPGNGRGWIRIADVTASRVTLGKTEQYLSPLGEAKSVAVDPGDLIMSICASVGVPRFVGIPACIHDGFVVFSDYETVLDKRFLYHYLSVFAPITGKKFGQHGSQTNLNTSLVGEMEIISLPMQEQRRIADIIDNWDSAALLLEQSLEATRKRLQGLMQQLLIGQKRIPGFTKSWQPFPLRAILTDCRRPVIKPSSSYVSLGVRSHCKGTFTKIVEDPGAVASETLWVVEGGDFVINIVFAWEGAVAIVPMEHSGAIVSHRFPVFRPKDDAIEIDYLRALMTSPWFIHQIRLNSPGGAGRNKTLNISTFMDTEVLLPTKEEQIKIAHVLSTQGREIAMLEKLAAAYRTQKIGLMQQLLTGKRRVKIQAA